MRRANRFLLVLISIILLSGCAKNNTTMKINKDKSMNLEVQILIMDEYKNTLSANFDSEEIEKRGFKVTTTNKDNYSGYKITKKFDNIDELSKGDNSVVEISKLLNSDFDFSKLFSKKEDFFKETYTANFKYSINEYKNKYLTSDDEDEEEEEDSSDKINSLDLTYTLVIPTASKTNDATDVSGGGKNLVWKLSSTSDSKINYSFAIYNYKHIFMICGGSLLIVAILITILVIIKKKKSSKGTLIYKEYDPSIESELNSNEIIKDNNDTQTQNTPIPEEVAPSLNENVAVSENVNPQGEIVPDNNQNQNNNYF